MNAGNPNEIVITNYRFGRHKNAKNLFNSMESVESATLRYDIGYDLINNAKKRLTNNLPR